MNIVVYLLISICSLPAYLRAADVSCSTPVGQSIVDDVCRRFMFDALQALELGSLQQLNPHVGEGGCHVRALQVLELYALGQQARAHDRSLTDCLAPADKRFITLAYFFTRYKKQEFIGRQLRHETIDEAAIRSSCGLSSGKTDAVKRVGQRELAAYTHELMCSATTQDPELQRALAFCILDDARFKRQCIGCLPSMWYVLERVRERCIPCLLRVVHTCNDEQHLVELLLERDAAATGHRCTACAINQQWATAPTLPGEQGVLCIDAMSMSTQEPTPSTCDQVRTYAERLCAQPDYYQILLAAAAATHQFTGEQMHTPFPYELLQLPRLHERANALAAWAHEHGCSTDNPTLLVTQHLRCMTIRELRAEAATAGQTKTARTPCQ